LDTKGNIFGGFTPVEWESGPVHGKADQSQKSFVFTVKNPHNLSARRFCLKSDKKHQAISCNSGSGPDFYDISVSGQCHSDMESYAYFNGTHDVYKNDTGLNGETLFAGSNCFRVEEIEVFEITD
jgi:hypothetical protein